MKKQFGLPLMLASALAFSACSSDDVAENGATNGSYDFTKGGYMAVNINLPSKSAGAFKGVNDDFNDGLPSEYAVKKATLVLFEKATSSKEGDATFHSIYDLGNISMEMDGSTQITSTVKVVKQAHDNAQGKNLLGIVILNGSNTLVDVAGESINGVNLTSTTKFSELVKSVTNGDASNYYSATDGFLMMNAPLATQQGGATPVTSADADIATLVDVTSNVYGTKEEALAKTAANFYVERALAKVTFNGSKGQIKGTDVTLDGISQTNVMHWSVENWNLDVTNKKSYFVHNMTGVNNTLQTDYTVNGAAIAAPFRFIGNTAVRTTDAKYRTYRTYWGVDPNYESYVPADFETKAADADINGELGAEKPQYCFENTFNVANQNQNQTTRAMVKVKLNNGNDFYVFNGDKSKLYSFDGCVKRIKGDIANLKNVHDWIVANLKAGETYDITATGNADVTLNNSTDYTTSAMVKVTNFSVKITATQSADGTEKTYTLGATDVSDLNAALKNNVTKYEGGIAYYPIRIKHFGNELTPWNNYNATTNATGHKANAGDVYGLTADPTKAAARFLGRYGVLRNNWYELEVNSITGIGEPRIPQVPTTSDPDDELKQFISVNINILSWAKRVQKEDL